MIADTLPQEHIRTILLLLDPSDPVSARTLEACSTVGGTVTSASRSLDQRFCVVNLQTSQEVDKYHTLITENKHHPISDHVRKLLIDLGRHDADDREKDGDPDRKASAVIFKCIHARELYIGRVQITLSSPNTFLSLTSLKLEHVNIQRKKGLPDFLQCFPQLRHLTLTKLMYGILSELSPPLPRTIRTLKVTLDEEEEMYPFGDALLSWMAHYPEKIPDIESLECRQVGDSTAEDLVLVLSYLKDVISSLGITIQFSHGWAEHILLAYVFSNELPLDAFTGSHGQDLVEAGRDFEW